MKTTTISLFLLASSFALGGTSGIQFVYQPLTTLGTDQDTEIIVAKIPIIANAVPESVIGYVSARHKLLQREPPFAEDSNLLSCLSITVGAEWVAKPGHYAVTLNLSAMKPTERYGLTEDAVVEAAVDCIRRTINELGQETLWKIRIIPRSQDGTKWSKYETDYRAKSPK